MKVKQQQMIFKMDGKFDWKQETDNYWKVDLPAPRNVRYAISKLRSGLYHLDLIRLSDQGNDLCIGTNFKTLEEAQTRAELREARYEVKKATMERR